MVHRWEFHRVPDGLTLQPDHRSPTPPLAGGVFVWAIDSAPQPVPGV